MTDPVEPARTVTVDLDGGAMDMAVWLPPSGSGPGIVLVQEIFGVGEWVRAVATELAAEGYVVGAPDLYWRLDPGWTAAHDEEGLAQAFEMVGRLDVPGAVTDTVAALGALGQLDEVTGAAAVLGFCLGGTIAWLAAVAGEPAACVSYYGSGVPDAADEVDAVTCPTLLHFGGADPFIPPEQVAVVDGAVTGRDHVTLQLHEGAGHAFENDRAPAFHDPDAATVSRAQTLEFLRTHLALA